jgi:hypothetical protein
MAITGYANVAAAQAAGWTRIPIDRGVGKSPRYIPVLEKWLVGEAGSSGYMHRAQGDSDVDQGTADAQAVASLNGQRKHRATFTNPANGKTLAADRHLARITIGQDLFGPNQVVFSQSIIGADIVPITIPGLGATAQATGRLVRVGGIVVDESGPHDFVDGTADVFCAYMADP